MRIIAIIGLLLLAGCENWSWENARRAALNAPPGAWNWGGQQYAPQKPITCTVVGSSVFCY